MSNFKIKIDMKKFEKDLNKQLEKIVYEQQKELILKNKIEKGDNEMTILPQKEEELLQIILNKYGRLRLKFLKENKKAEYTIMFMNGTLNKHLKEIQETAQVRVDIIIEQLKKQNNLTEKMKNTDQLYWVGMMNSFKNTAEEIVLNELIYV